MDYFEISRYLDIARRRKYWIIIPFLAVLLGGMGYLLNVRKLFEAKTLVLVQTQSVPKEYVRSVVTEGVDERLKTIFQEVTSRTNLEAIARQCGLYALGGTIGEPVDLDDLVGDVQQRITISMDTGQDQSRKGRSVPKTLDSATAFTISFLGTTRENAVLVTDALASRYISENSEFRESQVKGTTTFLADELESTKKRLDEKEQELKAYRERFMGGLPEQLNPNLAKLQSLQSRADQLSRDLSDLENRKFVVQQNLEEMRRAGQTVTSYTGKNYEVKDLAFLRSELLDLQTRYTDNHPDVVRLKKVIEALEALAPEKRAPPTTKLAGLPKGEQTLVQQLDVVDLDIAKTKTEMRITQGEISAYQKRIDDTPKREQELLLMQRDYKSLKDQYDSLEKRRLEANLALNMEMKQKSEQFRILDPAKLTSNYPVLPNVKKVLLMILVLGIGLSGGLAYFRETMDTSFKTPEEAEKELGMKILVSTPFKYTKRELRGRKIKEAAFASSVAAGFVVYAAAIVFFTGGVDNTLTGLNMLLGIK